MISEFAVGDRVWAWWNSPQRYYYVGTVLRAGGIVRTPEGAVKSATDYLVRFDDGDEMSVAPDQIFSLTLPSGLEVEFRTPDNLNYKPPVIASATPDVV